MLKQLIFLFTLIVIVLTSCASADHNQPSQELLYEEQNDYFPINETMTLFPRWPNREFDTTLTIEGIGLTSSKDFFVVIHTQVTSAPDLFTRGSMTYYPSVKLNGRDILLNQILWHEGSENVYRKNEYRYAVRSKNQIAAFPNELFIDGHIISLKKESKGQLQRKHKLDAKIVKFYQRTTNR